MEEGCWPVMESNASSFLITKFLQFLGPLVSGRDFAFRVASSFKHLEKGPQTTSFPQRDPCFLFFSLVTCSPFLLGSLLWISLSHREHALTRNTSRRGPWFQWRALFEGCAIDLASTETTRRK